MTHELLYEARLADTRLSDDRHEPAPAGCRRVLELAPQDGKLVGAPDQEAAEPPRRAPVRAIERRSTDRRAPARTCPSLQAARPPATSTASRTRRRVGSPISTSPGEAACSSRAAVLTASPVTKVSRLLASPATTSPVCTPIRNAIVDPHPAQQLLVQAHHSLLHLPCGAHGPERIVLVSDRYAEDGHHRVAHELLHRPPVPLDRARASSGSSGTSAPAPTPRRLARPSRSSPRRRRRARSRSSASRARPGRAPHRSPGRTRTPLGSRGRRHRSSARVQRMPISAGTRLALSVI